LDTSPTSLARSTMGKTVNPPSCENLSIAAIVQDPTVIGWTVGLLATQLILNLILGSMPGPMQAKYATAAHQFCCFGAFVYCAFTGSQLWLFDADLAERHAGNSYAARYLECTPAQQHVVKQMLGFQVYDAIATLLIADLLSAIGMIHHIVTGLFMAFALSSGSLMPYAPFFCGIAEVSSLPLSIFDLFKQCPELNKTSKLVAAFGEVSKIAFAVIFLIVRVVWWPLVIYRMLSDMHAAYDASDARFQLVAASYHAFTAIGLTLLQQFWGQKVIAGIMKLVQGDAGKKKK